jgi:hypothetical protein
VSSTRKSTSGLFHQERFCSSSEFEGDAINGLAAAKRIAIVKDRVVREILWFVQWRSLVPGGLQQLCNELVCAFPERIGTPLLNSLTASKRRFAKEKEIRALRSECGLVDDWDIDVLLDGEFKLSEIPLRQWNLEFYKDRAVDATRGFPQLLTAFCLDPEADISKGVWFFTDLLGALIALRERFILAARSRLADTVVTRRINETLDFWFARRRMILIEGVAGIGRTATTRAWCDAHAGLARYVEVPSSSDDRSFFASVARELGVARGASFKAQQIKVRVEEMLSTSGLMLAFDESQYLWTQIMRPRRTPDRLLWIKSILDAGTPIALIAHSDFSKWREHYVARTLWADEQFERRLNRRISLPTEHSREDMLEIARAHLPTGDSRSLKLLASYALGTEKKQASGIVEALESARYRAELDGRDQVTFSDIEAALMHDHCFLNPTSAGALQQPRTPIAKAVKRTGKSAHTRPVPVERNGADSHFTIRGGRGAGARVTTPIAT